MRPVRWSEGLRREPLRARWRSVCPLSKWEREHTEPAAQVGRQDAFYLCGLCGGRCRAHALSLKPAGVLNRGPAATRCEPVNPLFTLPPRTTRAAYLEMGQSERLGPRLRGPNARPNSLVAQGTGRATTHLPALPAAFYRRPFAQLAASSLNSLHGAKAEPRLWDGRRGSKEPSGNYAARAFSSQCRPIAGSPKRRFVRMRSLTDDVCTKLLTRWMAMLTPTLAAPEIKAAVTGAARSGDAAR